jgi:raffinose/stachyose/melibiose transport system permease protein
VEKYVIDRRKVNITSAIGIFLLSVLAFLYIVPFYIALVNTFKIEKDIFESPMGIPFQRLTLDNLARNFNSSNFNVLRAYFFTILIVFITLITVGLLASMMSYTLSRKRTGFYKFSYLLLLAGLMIPIQVILIPIIQILKAVHLVLTVPGLILVYIAWYMPFTSFVLTGYMGTISTQLDESATIDGATPFLIFFRIILPLIKPALASVIIFITVWTWNDFVTPLVIFGSSKFYTVTTGIYRAVGQYTQKWDDVFAILFFAATPLVVFFLMAQRQFISGLTAGSLKG